jgi:hypothetical protein
MNRDKIIMTLRMCEEIISKNMSKGDVILMCTLLQNLLGEIVMAQNRIVHGNSEHLIIDELEDGHADTATT